MKAVARSIGLASLCSLLAVHQVAAAEDVSTEVLPLGTLFATAPGPPTAGVPHILPTVLAQSGLLLVNLYPPAAFNPKHEPNSQTYHLWSIDPASKQIREWIYAVRCPVKEPGREVPFCTEAMILLGRSLTDSVPLKLDTGALTKVLAGRGVGASHGYTVAIKDPSYCQNRGWNQPETKPLDCKKLLGIDFKPLRILVNTRK